MAYYFYYQPYIALHRRIISRVGILVNENSLYPRGCIFAKNYVLAFLQYNKHEEVLPVSPTDKHCFNKEKGMNYQAAHLHKIPLKGGLTFFIFKVVSKYMCILKLYMKTFSNQQSATSITTNKTETKGP